MNALAKTVRTTLALAVLLASPGLAPYAAAAGNFEAGARAGVPSIAVPSASLGALPVSGVPNISAVGRNLAAPSGAVMPGVALPPSAALADQGAVAAGPASFAAALPAVRAAGAPAQAPAAHRLAANDARLGVIEGGAAPAGAPQAAVSAQSQLASGAARIGQASQPTGSALAGKAVSDQVFSGAAGLGASNADAPMAGAMPAALAPLGRSTGLQGDSERSVEPVPPRQPRQSLARSARVGLIAAVVPIALTMGTMVVAQALGYHFHAGYQAPFPHQLTAVTAVTSMIAAAFMAPVSEELIFRGGLMGWIKKMTPARLGATMQFLIPAALSSLVFVAVHEMSDPVLFATRFIHSMILSYAFHKEGYTGSMFAHGFFNGLLFAPALISVLLPGPLATVAGLLLVPAVLHFAWKALKKLRSEAPEKKSGALVAYTITPGQALLLAAALAAGFFFIMGNIVWAVGALGWLGYAIKRWASARKS